MFRWFKRRIANYLDDWQRREIARLHRQALRLKQEVEQKTGKPLQLTSEERCRLAKRAKGIDPETLKRISVFDSKEFMSFDQNTDSTENQ